MQYLRIASLSVLFLALACRGFNWPEPLDPKTAAQGTPVFAVSTTSPVDGASGVANNTQIVVHFNESVNTGLLSYNSTSGSCASNNFQVSADDFATCIGLTTPVWGSGQTTLTMTPAATLANGTTYKIRVLTTLASTSGRTLSTVFTTTAGFTTAPPGTLVPSMGSPSDGATAVSVNTALIINFTHSVNTGSLAYNTTAGPCTGSLQVSADGFVNCIAFPSHVFMVADTQLTITPTVALYYNTLYRVRITTALTGAGAEMLAGNFTSTGFTTDAPPALTVSLASPADGSTSVSPATTLNLAFNHAVAVGTVTFNNVAGPCTGSVQISPDGFSTCVGLNAPSWGGGNTILTLTPSSALNPGALYRVKVTTAVTGAVGNVLASDFVTPSGIGILISAPASLNVFSSNSQNMLVWPTVSGATSYNVYFSTSAGVTTGTGTLIAGVTAPYVHTGLTNGTTYFYIVAGANGGNIGTASSEASAVPVAARRIFVTSLSYNGNMGGISGADANCQARATAASLPGQYRAYLSDSTQDAVCRVLGRSGQLSSNCGLPVAPDLTAIGPYQNMSAQVINVNLDSLIYGKAPVTATCSGGGPSLLNSVSFTEFGVSAGAASVFTGTECGVNQGTHCNNWTDGLLGNGLSGAASSTTATWSSNPSLLTCLTSARLYCVQYGN